ncbi:HET-domain-containing protein, partial [Amniculicola lignicola CBS 123094]
KSWLHDCESNHVFCRQRGNAQVQLPTRLIEIVDADTARLVETAGQTGQYIALSYCWGSEPGNNSMTLKANLSERLESLPRDTLPGAIRDAVTIADRLGMKYIWVDALCMVQDDAQDKNVELGNMSQYYRNSWLTIAASTSSCTTGFIGTTGRCENHPGNTLPRDLVPLNIPINKRAWTLQEGILAPRVLLFGSRVIWFCQHMTRKFQMELSKLDTEVSNTSTEPLRTAGLDEDQNIYDLWHRIVGSYSKRAVSYPQDKLPAISALAAEVSKLTKDEYLAGLWRSNLLRDLLWTTPEPTTHRPDEWRAPTWSWASINDAILYDQLPPKSATALATVSDVATSPISGTVPFGEVQSGRLVIDAPCSWIKFDKGDDPAKTAAPFLRGFGFKIGKNERESLFEMLKTQARPSWKDPEETDEKEKKGYQLPDNITIAFMYGKRDDIVQPTDGDEDSGEKDQHWTMWGLILKHVSGDVSQGDDGILFERVMAFSQVPVGLEGGGLPPARRLHIV